MQMIIRIQHGDLLAELRRAGERNAVFATRWAANVTARDVAAATIDTIQHRFAATPRGMKFLLDHVKVLGSGSPLTRGLVGKNYNLRNSALVGVVPPEGSKGQFASWSRYRGSMLPMLEAGGKTPGPRDFAGNGALGRYWIPARGPRDRPLVPQSMYPINLGLQAARNISGSLSRPRKQGLRRTFVLPTRAGRGTLFQRTGKGRNSRVQALFHMHSQAYLPARRFFFPTAQRVVADRFPIHLKQAIQQALFGRGAYKGYQENRSTLGPAR